MQIFNSLAYMVMSLWGSTPAYDPLTFPPALDQKEQIRYVMDSWVKEEDKRMVMPEELYEVICMYILTDYSKGFACNKVYPGLFKSLVENDGGLHRIAIGRKKNFALFFHDYLGIYSLPKHRADQQKIFVTIQRKKIRTACFDSQDKCVAMGDEEGVVSIGVLKEKENLKGDLMFGNLPKVHFNGHGGYTLNPLKTICFIEQGPCFVSSCTQKTCVWSYDQRISEIFSLPKSYEGVYPNPYNPIIACRSFDKLSFIDIRFCQPVLVPIKKRAGVMDFAFSPIGGKMAVAGRDGLDIYDLRFLDKKNFFKQLSSDLNFTIDYSADGVLGAISVEQNTIRLYDGDTIRKIDTGHDCDDFGFVGSDIVVRGSTGVNVFSPLS